jgi:hypothetical protein
MKIHAYKPGPGDRCIEGLHIDRSGINCGLPAGSPIHGSPPVKLTSAQAAARSGVLPNTWSGYVVRGQAPRPDGTADPYDLPWWWSSTVDAWITARDKRIADRAAAHPDREGTT